MGSAVARKHRVNQTVLDAIDDIGDLGEYIKRRDRTNTKKTFDKIRQKLDKLAEISAEKRTVTQRGKPHVIIGEDENGDIGTLCNNCHKNHAVWTNPGNLEYPNVCDDCMEQYDDWGLDDEDEIDPTTYEEIPS